MDTGRGAFKLATVGGIEIKAHWSWLILVLLLTFSLAEGLFAQYVPGQSQLTYWVLGLVASLLLFASVLLHELSHSFTARARGYGVRDITLFIFGGVSNIEEEPKEAGDEFLIAVVGPLTSFVLGGICFALLIAVAGSLSSFALRDIFFGLVPGAPAPSRTMNPVEALLVFMVRMNILLGLFNMIPGFPLDGGRVFRSIVWGINHNFERATRIAGFIGELVAYGFIFGGLAQTFLGGDLGGLWIAFIGWFLLNAAQQSVTGVVMRDMLRGVTVAQVMQPAPPACTPNITLGQLLTGYVLPHNLRALPVVQDGRLLGIVTLGDIKHVPQEQWDMTTVGQVMTGIDKLRVVGPQDNLIKAMQFLGEGDFDQLPVVDQSGQLVGMLTRAQLVRWLQIREELKLRTGRQGVMRNV